MRFIIIIMAAVFGLSCSAADIKPVLTWPKVLAVPGKTIVAPSVPQCVEQGLRLIPTLKPVIPAGTRLVSSEIIQDPAAYERCKWEIVVESIPVIIPPVIKPVGTVTVAVDRVKYVFATNGMYRGAIWLDAPVSVTNK